VSADPFEGEFDAIAALAALDNLDEVLFEDAPLDLPVAGLAAAFPPGNDNSDLVVRSNATVISCGHR